MAKSIQEYVDSLYNQGLNNANNLKEQRTQADEAFIKQVQDAIDKSTASAAKPYQTQIEQLPSQYQKLYDTNAVQELVNRRQVQETMANMGLTDSGLNPADGHRHPAGERRRGGAAGTAAENPGIAG